MKKIIIPVLLICILVVPVSLLLNKPDSRVFRIGVINYSPAADSALEGLKEGLQFLGYREDENIQFIYNGFIKDKTKLHQEAVSLENEKPDLIYAMSTPATLAAKKATEQSGLPIVFGPVSNPVKAGIVKSLSDPGGNITGVTFGPQEPKRLEILLKIVPDIKKIYVPYNPDDKSPRLGIQRLKISAAKLGITILPALIHSKQELVASLENFPGDADAIFVPTDSLMVALTDFLVSFSLKHQIPLTTPHREGVSRGALYSFGFDIRDCGRQASRLVNKILKGENPRDLPVELSEFVLAINLKTAETIHVSVPDSLLRHAVIFRNIEK